MKVPTAEVSTSAVGATTLTTTGTITNTAMTAAGCGCASRTGGPRCCGQETTALRVEVSKLRADLKQALSRVEEERRAARGARLAASSLRSRADAAASRADALETRVTRAEQRAKIAERKVHTTEEARRSAERALRAADMAASTHHSRLQRSLASSSASPTANLKKRLSSSSSGSGAQRDDGTACPRCYAKGRSALLRVIAVFVSRLTKPIKNIEEGCMMTLDTSSSTAADEGTTPTFSKAMDKNHDGDTTRMTVDEPSSPGDTLSRTTSYDQQQANAAAKDLAPECTKTGCEADGNVAMFDDDVTSALSDFVDDSHDDNEDVDVEEHEHEDPNEEEEEEKEADDNSNDGDTIIATPASARQCRFVASTDSSSSLTLWGKAGLSAALSDTNHLSHPFHGFTVITTSSSSVTNS